MMASAVKIANVMPISKASSLKLNSHRKNSPTASLILKSISDFIGIAFSVVSLLRKDLCENFPKSLIYNEIGHITLAVLRSAVRSR